jgi:hypothetical protein
MKNIAAITAVAFILLAMVACSPSVNVVSDYDRTVDFNKYSTFEFYGWPEGIDGNMSRFDQERIEQAVKNEFERRGITQVDSDGNLIVTLIAILEEEMETRTISDNPGYRYFGHYYGFGPGYPWGPGYTTTTVQEFDYTVGTLVIDVFDAREEVLVWEGRGARVIEENPERRERTIPNAVRQIMEEFPVRPRD